MAIDKFANNTDSVFAPARQCFAINPDDFTDLSTLTKAIYVGGSGDLALQSADNEGQHVIFKGIPAGTMLPVRAIRVLSSDTSATDIVGLA